nr:hypothetical protein [uncultured Nocardioides sp.]
MFVREFDDSLAMTTKAATVAVGLTLPWLRLPRVPWPWVAFLVLCAASQLWSVDDGATDASVVLYLHMTVLAVVVAANCEPPVVAWGMALGGAAVVALSIYAFEKTMWGSSYVGVEGLAFAGVGTNENILAYTLAISLAAALAVGRPRQWWALAAWLTVLASNGYGLYLANSGTGYLSVFALVVAITSIQLWPAIRRAGRRIGAVWVLAVAVLLLVILGLVGVLLGKQISTVSGRSPLWVAAFESTMHYAPVLGSGWGAVWEHPWDLTVPNDVSRDIYARAGFTLAHGHNFFVDVLPEIGLLGVAVAVLMVAYAVREVRRCGLQPGAIDPRSGRLTLMVLVALLVSGVSEPMLTVPLGWWSLALVVALSRQHAPLPTTTPSPRRRGGRHAGEVEGVHGTATTRDGDAPSGTGDSVAETPAGR